MKKKKKKETESGESRMDGDEVDGAKTNQRRRPDERKWKGRES